MLNGAVAELQCAAILVEIGWSVSLPITHENPYDIVIYRDGVLRTVQVKSSSATQSDRTCVMADFSKYRDIDYIIIWDAPQGDWYIFTRGELNRVKRLTLNKDNNKDNNSK